MEKNKNHTNYPQLGPQYFPQYSTNHHSNYTGFPQKHMVRNLKKSFKKNLTYQVQKFIY